MEINGVSSKAYTSAAASIEEELEQTQPEQTQEFGAAPKEKEQKDVAEFSTSEFDETDVEKKASAYIQNIIFAEGLTDEAKAALNDYLSTFDAAKFIRSYGPFSSSAEISAAMYAVTAGLIKHPQDE